ncbi:MAG: DUF695 domain-containing protein [Epsilonproteobacteria bacterium]|nr:DUF695 domain-containing protein [Campylobacterota bacterium]
MRELFVREEDSHNVIIEVELDTQEIQEMNPWLLSIFIKYDSTKQDKDTYEEFLETKESLIIALEHNQRALYVGSRVVDGWNEFYFYSYDSKNLDKTVKKILSPSEYIFENNIVRDTKWEFYENQLVPNELELHHIESSKIIFLLQEEGEDLSISRDVEHYVSFLTPTQKDRFLENLNLDGFSFKDEISSEEFEHGVALIKKHIVTHNELRKVVEELFIKIKEDGGFYEGWSTTLVTQNLD